MPAVTADKIINGDTFAKENPAETLIKVEKFLGLEQFSNLQDYFFSSEKGFRCAKNSGCLHDEKGHKFPPLNQTVAAKFRRYFKPFNKEFYKLTGIDFHWK
ncbi:hypothetical protein CAPTEDRAFT_146061 [Capitella teleta]|uniref:Sulfotransferase domain-containing protein n=1 Tax=Capitella teleta TaxID=283909 RepID=R7UDY4_CAPTE|nr:hypothetical protein CAPTEDRAFT_146061 [Capitella teleta]|eukprot:ELU01983.1 hypothetical protein CAPTEDRAFT_146061 [Capitella teleta]